MEFKNKHEKGLNPLWARWLGRTFPIPLGAHTLRDLSAAPWVVGPHASVALGLGRRLSAVRRFLDHNKKNRKRGELPKKS